METNIVLIEEGIVLRSKKWIMKAKELYNIQQKIKLLEKIEEQLSEELKELSENKSSMGGGFKYLCIPRKGTIDYKVIPQLHGINLDKYRKPDSTCWKLSYENFELIK